MLISCPDCERKVSDRAKACPDCGFPVNDHVLEQSREAERLARLASRERIGEVDCPSCDARGFSYFEAENDEGQTRQMFGWCEPCKHSGRVHQCRDTAGYYAVSHAALEGFLLGVLDPSGKPDEGVVFVGTQQITEHRYERAGETWTEDEQGDPSPD
jgi:hypothetical protein